MTTTAIKDLVPSPGNFGTISYGGVVFTVLKKADFAAQPQYDEADRTVTHVRYLMRISDAVVWSDDTPSQDASMATLQTLLSTPGLQLIIDSIGFDTTVNTAAGGTKPDLLWGVKPRAFNLRPTGGELSWMFDWECEFNISRCANPLALTQKTPPLLAWNYEWTGSVNDEGLMQRVITGYVQVPAVRGLPPEQAAILFDVVSAWDNISIKIPYGFRRTNNTYSVNKAKNRIDFSITDTELVSDAYPAGIVACELDYDLASGQGLAQWTGTLSGSLTVAPGYPKSLGAIKFLAIVAFYVPKLKAIAISSDQKQPSVIPISLRLGHRLFSRTSRFAATYMFAATADSILQQSGMWDPVPGTDYQQWATSMVVAGVWDNHGTSQLKADTSQDAIINLCLEGKPGLDELSKHKFDGTNTPDLMHSSLRTVDRNYLAYKNRCVPLMRRNAVIHKFAQKYTPGDANYQDHVVQDRSAPDQLVRMVGYACRLNAAPEMPQLKTVGGKAVELLEQSGGQDDNPITVAFGNRVYRAIWDNLYRIVGQPIAPPLEPAALPVAGHATALPLTGGTIDETTLRPAGEESQVVPDAEP